jgi:uroporphyrinogen decarboxylase
MTSREIVLANIEQSGAPRPGFTFSGGRLDDAISAPAKPHGYVQRRWTEGDNELYDDEWGNLWVRKQGRSTKGEIHTPVIRDWSQLRDLRLPDYSHPDCSTEMTELFARPTDKFRLASIGGWVFDNARYLRKLEVYLEDMALYPQEVRALNAKVAGVYEQKIHLAGRAKADGIVVGEDLGTQTGLLFSPAMFREILKPTYTRLMGIAHEYGMKVFMHSCGLNWLIVPDLMDVGVDVFQFDQPALYDMEALARLMKERRRALWSPVDI